MQTETQEMITPHDEVALLVLEELVHKYVESNITSTILRIFTIKHSLLFEHFLGAKYGLTPFFYLLKFFQLLY